MGDIVNNIISAPIANLLVFAGIIFLGIAVVGKIIGKIEPGKSGRIISGIIGMTLLIIGLFMHFKQNQIPKQPKSKPSITGTKTIKPTPSSSSLVLPELFVSEFEFKPQVPIQSEPVAVRIGVYNKGRKRSGPFKVQWWAGENFPKPEHEWKIESMAARGGKILKFTYKGYRSWYANLFTKVIIDPERQIKEYDKKNNIFKSKISVKKK